MDASAWISGAIAGQTSLLVVQPLDVIRTKLQTSTKQQYSGPIDCFTKILKNDGLPGFYRGIIPPFFAQGLYKAIMFGSFHNSSTFFKNYNATKHNLDISSPQTALTPLQLLLCGSFSGIVNSIVVTPVELIRNRLIVANQPPPSSASTTQALNSAAQPYVKPTITSIIRDVYRTHGLRGLWKGQLSCSLRDGVGVGAYFYGNTRFVQYLKENYENMPNSVVQLLGGMIAGICFWTFSLPLDRIKSIIQTQTAQSQIDYATKSSQMSQIISIVKHIIKNEGLKGLYRGYSVGVGRGIPAGAITFYVNSTMMQFFANQKAAKVSRHD